jgi:uncharacterized protein YabN with tetrapyrrole methylase and pyrophosphatase domain
VNCLTHLTIVGTGIAGPVHVTIQAMTAIEGAEKVCFLAADPVTQAWIESLRPDAEDLGTAYAVGRRRMDSYQSMVERILGPVRLGKRVCAAFYGHPGVFAFPSHEAVRRARQEGYTAAMLPAVSAEDCMFADLGVDPGSCGCQSFETTDFLVQRRKHDPSSGLVLWQAGAIAVSDHRRGNLWNREGLQVLMDVLLESYPPDHPITIYEANSFPIGESKILRVALAALGQAPVTGLSTLWIEPLPNRAPDLEVLRRLGLRALKDE